MPPPFAAIDNPSFSPAVPKFKAIGSIIFVPFAAENLSVGLDITFDGVVNLSYIWLKVPSALNLIISSFWLAPLIATSFNGSSVSISILHSFNSSFHKLYVKLILCLLPCSSYISIVL